MEEKSPPSEVKAPPMAIDLAESVGKFCEYLIASVTYWACIVETHATTITIEIIFFIVYDSYELFDATVKE